MTITNQKDFEQIYQITPGKFRCDLYTSSNKILSRNFASEYMAWVAGENWKMLNNENGYIIIDTTKETPKETTP